jgi:ABC-type Na+ efflux pump permease subunit
VKIIIVLALLLSVGSWAFLGLTFTHLLSGYFEDRTCLTDCVKTYYFAAAGLGLAGISLAAVAWVRSGFTRWPFFSLIVTALPFAIVAGIFIMGMLGSMPH